MKKREKRIVCNIHVPIIHLCSGITCGRVLNGELCAQRFQKLLYLHLFTELFHEDLSSVIRKYTVLSSIGTNTAVVLILDETVV